MAGALRFQGPDRRLRVRFKARVPFVIKNGGQEVSGITANISLLGISAYTSNSVGAVQPVECHLQVPNLSQPIIAKGTIIRCNPLSHPHPDGAFQMGVFFKEFEGRGESTLIQFLESLRDQEQKAIESGYRDLRKRINDRKRRKRLEALQKKKRKLARLRKKQRRLERIKKLKQLKAKLRKQKSLARKRPKRRS